jgi:hypothetical protein
MTLPSSDPDAAERFRWRYERACREYAAGGSEAVLKASLKCAGYYGMRLAEEVRYQVGLKGEVARKTIGLVSGLPTRQW